MASKVARRFHSAHQEARTRGIVTPELSDPVR
jgi:hypothetical protein